MTYRLAAADSHPLPWGTQARACSVEHGWIFGPIIWRYRNPDGIHIYTVQDPNEPQRHVDVPAYKIETLHESPAEAENRIEEVKLTLLDNGHWEVAVRKTFIPACGGGEQWFKADGGREIHFALDRAREMVTLSPARRTDV